jgi:hypothetical protein
MRSRGLGALAVVATSLGAAATAQGHEVVRGTAFRSAEPLPLEREFRGIAAEADDPTGPDPVLLAPYDRGADVRYVHTPLTTRLTPGPFGAGINDLLRLERSGSRRTLVAATETGLRVQDHDVGGERPVASPPRRLGTPSTNYTAVAAGELPGHGQVLAALDDASDLHLFSATAPAGAGPLATASVFGSGRTDRPAFADVDGDGDPEIVVRDSFGADIKALRLEADGLDDLRAPWYLDGAGGFKLAGLPSPRVGAGDGLVFDAQGTLMFSESGPRGFSAPVVLLAGLGGLSDMRATPSAGEGVPLDDTGRPAVLAVDAHHGLLVVRRDEDRAQRITVETYPLPPGAGRFGSQLALTDIGGGPRPSVLISNGEQAGLTLLRPNAAPRAGLVPEPSVFASVPATFRLSAADADDPADLARWRLDPGDGTAPREGTGRPPAELAHAFARPGETVVRLTVTDSAGATDTAEAVVTVLRGSTTIRPRAVTTSVVAGRSPVLQAELALGGIGRPLTGRPMRFSTGGRVLCTALTDDAGVATCAPPADAFPSVATAGFVATFEETEALAGSSATGTVVGDPRRGSR